MSVADPRIPAPLGRGVVKNEMSNINNSIQNE